MHIVAPKPGWRLRLIPDAGEAGGSFRGRHTGSGGDWEYDPDRSLGEAVRRAKSKVRHFAAANRLNRLGTLTYAEACFDPKQVRSDVARFFRRLCRLFDGDRFPYLWVLELHPGRHGFHVHFLVGRYVPRGLIDKAWGLGFVHIKLIGDLPVGTSTREEARVAARYLLKYLGESFGGGSGLNRDNTSEGHQPVAVLVSAPTIEAITGRSRSGARCCRNPQGRPDE